MRAPHSEGEIRAVTIGELKPLTSPIMIAGYNPAWPDLFRREADGIRAVLGSKALRIEHAGSASVPGLAVKPWRHVQNYADAKTAVVEEIMDRAERYHQELRAAST